MPNEDSEDSKLGTLLHDYAHHKEYERFVLSPEQRDLLNRCEELERTVIALVTQQFGFENPTSETEVELVGLGGLLTGHADRIDYTETTVLVIERKFGFIPVEKAELNLQTRAYSLMASDKSENVIVAIVQPRLSVSERITMAVYTRDDIKASEKQIRGIIEATRRENAPLVPGEEQCRYCRARAICPALREVVLSVTDNRFYPDATLSKTAREAYLEKRLAEIDDPTLSRMLEAIKFAKLLSDLANDEARKRIVAGAMTDYELGKESEVREITDVRRAISLLSLAGMDKSDIFACVTKFSLTSLGEQLRKVHPTWDWKTVNDWVNRKLKSVIEIETRKPRILKK